MGRAVGGGVGGGGKYHTLNRLHFILKTIKLPSTSTTAVYIPEKAMKTPIAAVKSSGAEPPAAMKVAPATSSLIPPVK
jgi:hypothetical protein